MSQWFIIFLNIANLIIWSLSKYYIIANNTAIFDISISFNNVKILSEVAQCIHLNHWISYQCQFYINTELWKQNRQL